MSDCRIFQQESGYTPELEPDIADAGCVILGVGACQKSDKISEGLTYSGKFSRGIPKTSLMIFRSCLLAGCPKLSSFNLGCGILPEIIK